MILLCWFLRTAQQPSERIGEQYRRRMNRLFESGPSPLCTQTSTRKRENAPCLAAADEQHESEILYSGELPTTSKHENVPSLSRLVLRPRHKRRVAKQILEDFRNKHRLIILYSETGPSCQLATMTDSKKTLAFGQAEKTSNATIPCYRCFVAIGLNDRYIKRKRTESEAPVAR